MPHRAVTSPPNTISRHPLRHLSSNTTKQISFTYRAKLYDNHRARKRRGGGDLYTVYTEKNVKKKCIETNNMKIEMEEMASRVHRVQGRQAGSIFEMKQTCSQGHPRPWHQALSTHAMCHIPPWHPHTKHAMRPSPAPPLMKRHNNRHPQLGQDRPRRKIGDPVVSYKYFTWLPPPPPDGGT